MYKCIKRSVVLLLLLSLFACGFQMRGQSPSLAAESSIWVDSRYTDLAALLTKRLLQNKARLISESEGKEKADRVINITETNTSQSPVAYDSQGDVIEYSLRYHIRFSIDDKSYPFTATESYRYNKAQLLSSEQNKRAAKLFLQEQAVAFIMRQL